MIRASQLGFVASTLHKSVAAMRTDIMIPFQTVRSAHYEQFETVQSKSEKSPKSGT
ncbi:hypothetical protein ABID25_006543 [Mesorhizobium abyssinicae]